MYNTMKLLEDNIGENVQSLGFSVTFRIQHWKHNPWKKTIKKLDFMKNVDFSVKDTVREWEGKTQTKQMFAKHSIDKGFVPKTYKELKTQQ